MPRLIKVLPLLALGLLLIGGSIIYFTYPKTAPVKEKDPSRLYINDFNGQMGKNYWELDVPNNSQWFDTGQLLGKGGHLNLVTAGEGSEQPFDIKVGQQEFTSELRDEGKDIVGTPSGEMRFILNVIAQDEIPEWAKKADVKDYEKIYVRANQKASAPRLLLRMSIDYRRAQ